MRLVILVAVIGLAGPAFAGPSGECGGFGESDCDGVPDAIDNCALVPNPAPLNCDTDLDGYGNLCDGDFDNNQVTTTGDVAHFWLPVFTGANPDTIGADMDCNGSITGGDIAFFWLPLFTSGTLGPSGLNCAGSVPCPTP